MAKVSKARVRVWCYQILMGTFDVKNEPVLLEALEDMSPVSLEPLERRVWASYKQHPLDEKNRKAYLENELSDWAKRTQN